MILSFKKHTICIFLLALSCYKSNAQNTDKDSIVQVINTFFTAMKLADTTLLNTTLTTDVQLQTIRKDKSKTPIVLSESITDFKKQIATLKPNTLNEVIEEYHINHNEKMANAWLPYSFYLNGAFAHCGVNNIVLVKLALGWKIHYIIDTRQAKPCNKLNE